MPDTNFNRSVVLLTECNAEGTVGFVLNKPLEIRLQDVLPEDLGDFDAPLYFGGPVEPDTLHYVHALGDRIDGAMEVVPGVFWGGSFEALKVILANGGVKKNHIRFYVGYSGWGSGQLEMEMKERSWIKTSLSREQVFSPKANLLWKQIMNGLGGRYKQMANYPLSPSLN
jgi:putative transcriptional regulator